MYLTKEAQASLKALIRLFEHGEAPAAIAIATLPALDIPSAKWTLRNRILMLSGGSMDARGAKQWAAVGRSVREGTSPIHILGPVFKPVESDEENSKKEGDPKEMRLIGFRGIPVYRVEDTEGDPLPDLKPQEPPPLLDVAAAWGIQVSWQGFQGHCYGFYRPGEGKIVLCSPDEKVFFHELSHVAHGRVRGKLKAGQDWKQEMVAELSATVLARLYGRSLPNEGESYEYVKRYAEKAGKDLGTALWSVLGDTAKVLALIMETAKINPQPVPAYQILTKRSERLLQLNLSLPWPRHVWMGVSVETADYSSRIDHLRDTAAAVKFLSLEPLLGPLDDLDLRGIDWVIVGGESGPGARPMSASWVVSIRDQCQRAGVPFFFKQWGGVNKKRDGRVLEGKTWDQMPEHQMPASAGWGGP